VDTDISETEMWLDIATEMERLAEEDRQILALWLLGRKQWEIALHYQVTQQAISYRIQRALKQLKNGVC